MKTREILKELLQVSAEVVLVPLTVSKYKIINVDNILSFEGKYYQSAKHLNRVGLVGFKEKDGVTTIYLTKNGKKVSLKYSLDDIEIKKPQKWDEKWRIIIFDIPDKYKAGRHAIQAKLSELGFVMLQKSVYVYPYECFDEIDFIRRVYNIKPFVKYILAEDIEDAKKMLWKFNKNGEI